MPKFEIPPESEKASEAAKKIFKSFLNRPDEPGEYLSDEQQKELIKRSATDPAAREKFLASKRSKYRTNSLTAPLMAAELFLTDDEAPKKMPEEKIEYFNKKIKQSKENITVASRTQITEKEIKAMESACAQAGLSKEITENFLDEACEHQEDRADVSNLQDIVEGMATPGAWNISKENIQHLQQTIAKIVQNARKERPGLLTPKEVNEVIEIINELQPYL
ncbi:MAG: hypothetical protein HZB99_01860 [Candidatus Harrisonbacteria bacterium]|nr:hypothetical protein [Candidatus Harrisonbacteria bacterium]